MIRAVMDMSVWDTGAMQEAVGAAIRTRREARGWKQEELGAHAHVDKGTVSRIERGTNTSVDTLLRLTRALDVELEITLRDPQGHTQTVRDVLPTVTPTVAVPSEPTVAPGEVSPLSSLPSSPSHVALYGIIGELDPDQARRVRRPIEELIEKLLSPEREDEPPAKRRPRS